MSRKFRHFSKGTKKFGHGVTKRVDSTGKFAGKIIKNHSNAVDGAIGNLSNPMVLIPLLIVGGIVAIKFL